MNIHPEKQTDILREVHRVATLRQRIRRPSFFGAGDRDTWKVDESFNALSRDVLMTMSLANIVAIYGTLWMMSMGKRGDDWHSLGTEASKKKFASYLCQLTRFVHYLTVIKGMATGQTSLEPAAVTQPSDATIELDEDSRQGTVPRSLLKNEAIATRQRYTAAFYPAFGQATSAHAIAHVDMTDAHSSQTPQGSVKPPLRPAPPPVPQNRWGRAACSSSTTPAEKPYPPAPPSPFQKLIRPVAPQTIPVGLNTATPPPPPPPQPATARAASPVPPLRPAAQLR